MKALFVDIFEDTYIFTKEEGFIPFYKIDFPSYDDILSLDEIDYVKASYDMSKILREMNIDYYVDSLTQAFDNVISGKDDEEWVDIECNECDDDDEYFEELYNSFRIYSYEVELDDFYNYD